MSDPDRDNAQYTEERAKNFVDHAKALSPIDRALTDLHNNIEDAHQMVTDLEMKIFAVLGPDLSTTKDPGLDGGTPKSSHSRIHDAISDQDERVVGLHDRIRNLIDRVEL